MLSHILRGAWEKLETMRAWFRGSGVEVPDLRFRASGWIPTRPSFQSAHEKGMTLFLPFAPATARFKLTTPLPSVIDRHARSRYPSLLHTLRLPGGHHSNQFTGFNSNPEKTILLVVLKYLEADIVFARYMKQAISRWPMVIFMLVYLYYFSNVTVDFPRGMYTSV